MRCLYCGKELAFLKRLTGGGEFCSDAHRQRYQEEYNQLALSRLMQSQTVEEIPDKKPKAKTERAAAADPAPATATETPAPETVAAAPPAELPPEVAAQPTAVPPKPPPPPAARPPEPPPDPTAAPAPLARFLVEPVRSARPGGAKLVTGGSVLARAGVPELPRLRAAAVSSLTDFPVAARTPWEPAIAVANLAGAPHRTGIEPREFVRVADPPRLTSVSLLTCAPALFHDPMELRTEVCAPSGGATFWQAEPPSFGIVPIERGELARLDFPHTGYETASVTAPAASPPAPPSATAQLPLAAPRPAGAKPASAAPVHLHPSRVEPMLVSSGVGVVADTAPAEAFPDEPPQPVPDKITRPLPLTLHGMAVGAPRIALVFSHALISPADPQVPRSSALPLRPAMLLGSAPSSERTASAPPKPAPARSEEPVPARAKVPAATPPSAPIQAEAPGPKPTEVPTRQSARSAGRGSTATPLRPNVRAAMPAAQAAPPTPREPMAPVEAERPPAPEPSVLPRPLSPPATDLDLGLPTLHLQTSQSRWSRLPAVLKIGIAAAIVAAATGLGYLVMSGPASAGNTAPSAQSTSYEAGLPLANDGWIENWAGSGSQTPKITLLRSTLPLSDYRMQLQAQIESKAIGWAYRALNPRNYYVAKLETIRPGLEPEVALVHYAVIDGQRENRVQTPLSMPLRVDTVYKIRFEAVGGRFTTWVQDQKIAEWTDRRIGSGGIGLYAEPGESLALQGRVDVIPLVPQN